MSKKTAKTKRVHLYSGLLFVVLFASVAFVVAGIEQVQTLRLSPLIIGVVLGMVYGNTVGQKSIDKKQSALGFCTSWILRSAIVFYGFRLDFGDVLHVGIAGVVSSVLVVGFTFVIGCFIGVRLLGLDKHVAILVSGGASICGAAAVLAIVPVIKSEGYKTSIAVATVVVFGTLSMFLYPYMYSLGIVSFTLGDMGIYVGASLHEVAHVVGAGGAIGGEAEENAIIVKMIRVLLLAPFLVVLGICLKKDKGEKNAIVIPRFAVGFILAVCINSVISIPKEILQIINTLDTFALTMAMCALGINTSFAKMAGVGMKPYYLGFILWVWLIVGGYFIVSFASQM